MIRKRAYIDDFVKDLNYRRILLYISEEIDVDKLRKKLEEDHCNKLYRLDYALEEYWDISDRRFFWIENCDFQDCDYPAIEKVIDDEFNIYILHYDPIADKFYYEIDH